MAVVSRNPREHWLKPLFSKNEVAKSGPAFHSNGNPAKGFGIIPRMDDLTEKTIDCERKYTGKIISVDLLDIELPDDAEQFARPQLQSTMRPMADQRRATPAAA